MKKKIWKYLLAICMFAGAFIFADCGNVDVWAGAEGGSGDFRYEELEDDIIKIIRYEGDDTVLTVPAVLDGHKVTSVEGIGRSFLTSVTFEEGIETINYCFSGCTALSDVTLPSSIMAIGENTFYGCSSLKEIILPDNVTTIGERAFYECSGLESISLPNSITSIGNYAFYHCSGLTSLIIPNSMTEIGEHVFDGCEKVVDLTIPDGVTSIGYCAFIDCKGLTDIELPGSVSSIGSSAFSYCEGLTDITLPDTVTFMDGFAFSFCNNLTKVTLPGKLTEVSQGMFYFCPKLQEITIPGSVASIGGNAFYYCSALKNINIPNGVTSIGDAAFGHCGLTDLMIPNSVTSIEEGAFSGCNMSIKIDGGNSAYVVENDILYDKGKTKVLYCPAGKKGKIQLSDSLISIGGNAFEGCQNLDDVAIPDSVTSIGSGAFRGCSKLSNIIVPSKVETLPVGVFYRCSNLKDITLPVSVTVIERGVFWECSNLQDIWYSGSKAQWENVSIDSYNDEISSVTIHCTDGVFTPADTKPAHPDSGNQIPDAGTTSPDTGTTSPDTETPTPDLNTQISDTSTQTPTQVSTDLNSKNVQLSKSSVTYNGKAQKPSVIVKNNEGSRIEPANYTVSYANNKNVGKATVTVKFSGNYQGTVKKTFNIIPKGTTISKVTAKKKGLSVKWKKQTTQTTGYEIQYSTSSKFKGAKKIGNIKAKTTSKSISKLKAKKKYYVRIRTYKTVKGKKYYSSWSKSKSVIILAKKRQLLCPQKLWEQMALRWLWCRQETVCFIITKL